MARTIDELVAEGNQQNQRLKPQVGGLKRLLAEAAPILGGTLGAIGGSFLAPVAGTAAGGAAGAGLGAAIKQNLLGQDTNVGDIAQEALFGALPGAGKLVKGALGAGKALTAAKGLGEGLQVSNVAKDIASTARPSTILGKVGQGARNVDMKQSGLEIGQSLRGKTLTPDSADNLYSFARSNGIKAGAPVEQARQAQELFKSKIANLDNTLTKIDRPVVSNEAKSIVDMVKGKVAENTAVTKGSLTADKFVTKIEGAKNLKDLEKIRREADNLAFTSRGAGKTSAAAQAQEVRNAIDDFITPLSPEYKAAKGDYVLAKDLLDLTSKGAKNAKGINILGMNVGNQAIPGIQSKASSLIQKLTGTGKKVDNAALATAFRPSQLLKQGIGQTAAQGIGNSLMTPDSTVQQPSDLIAPNEMSPMNTAQQQPSAASSIYTDPQAVEQMYNQALSSGNIQAANAILAGYKAFGESTKAAKPVSAESAKVLSNAKVGIDNINRIEELLAGDPSLQGKQGASGTFNPFGITGAVLGTGEYDNARDQVKDVIARLRTGAAITKEEQVMFDRYVPQAADSPETVKQKLDTLRGQFRFVMERAGGAGNDTQQLLGAQ